MLPLGEELRFRGVAPGEPSGGTTPRGEDSGSSVGPEPISAELLHEGHKRDAPGNSLPHAGHFISLWREYNIARFNALAPQGDSSRRNGAALSSPRALSAYSVTVTTREPEQGRRPD